MPGLYIVCIANYYALYARLNYCMQQVMLTSVNNCANMCFRALTWLIAMSFVVTYVNLNICVIAMQSIMLTSILMCIQAINCYSGCHRM